MTPTPERTEAAPYYFTYIDQVPEGDICAVLEAQGTEMLELLRSISDEQSLFRYAPDKWSVRDVVNHITDCERLFVFRALWFARGFESPLPGFDQDIAAIEAQADDRPWGSHIEELRAVRASSLAFFQSLPSELWARRGTASGYPFTVRAVAFIVAGHAAHHTRILRERYLPVAGDGSDSDAPA